MLKSCCLLAFFLTIRLVFPPVSGTQTPRPTAAGWPNLETLDNYPNRNGNQCSPGGSAPKGSEKSRSNALKNRFRLPERGFKAVLLSDLLNLPANAPSANRYSLNQNNARAVTVTGYVVSVKRGGSKGESCNCGATGEEQIDTHIELVLDPNTNDQTGQGMLVVEVTERARRLAAQGLLKSNITNDWSRANLRARLLNRWVRIAGWLFLDPDHIQEAWQTDPNDRLGYPNWRASSWEIHPVLGIETNVLPPPDAQRGSARPRPAAPGQPAQSPTPRPNTNNASAPVLGNRNSRLYHLPHCPGYPEINPRNRVRFRTEAEAQQAGYQRARNCP